MAQGSRKIVYKKGFTSSSGGGTGAVDSVNGKTGVVVLDKTDIGLSNVDNTSDLDKPVSTATQAEIDKVNNNAIAYAIALG